MFNKLLSLQTRPYGRKVYIKSVLILWALSFGIAILLGVAYGVVSFFLPAQEGLINLSAQILLGIFYVVLLYRITALRIEDAGDNKNLAWLVVVPLVNFILILVYFFRPSVGPTPTTQSQGLAEQ